MATDALVENLINNAISIAAQQAGVANGLIESAQAAFGWEMRDLDPPPPPGSTLVAPTFDQPLDEDSSITYKSDYDATAASVTAQMAGTFSGFLNTYFPNLSSVVAAAETWIQNAITNGGTGIPTDIENQIWQRGRDKESLEAARLAYVASSSFAANGFSLPPGALAGRLQEVQQESANKNSTFGRDVAIRQIEIEIENIRFAVKEAVDLRQQGILAAIEYWKAYLLPHRIAADRAGAIIDAKTKFSNALAAWFNAESSVYGHEVTNQGNYWRARTDGYRANAAAVSGLSQAQGDTAAAGAKAASDIASAAMSAMNTLAQVGYTETKNA